jgi:nucleotide-binding universal stress UspA family protein
LASDFSAASEPPARVARRLLDNSSRLSLVHVYDSTPFRLGFTESTPESARQLEDDAHTRLTALRARFPNEIDARVITIDAESSALAIADCARDQEADLIVVGTHGRSGLARLLIGSVAENVVRHAPCDVLTAPASVDDDWRLERILVAVDFSPASEHALRRVLAVATALGAEVVAAHSHDTAVPVPAADGSTGFMSTDDVEARLQERLQQWVAAVSPHGIGTVVIMGPTASDGILGYAAENHVDMVAVGAHGQSGLSRFLLGSVAERIVRGATRPVLVVRAPQE